VAKDEGKNEVAAAAVAKGDGNPVEILKKLDPTTLAFMDLAHAQVFNFDRQSAEGRMIAKLRQIKESGSYKEVMKKLNPATVAGFEPWPAYCRFVGSSSRTIDWLLQIADELGDESGELRRMGKFREMDCRAALAAPAEVKKLLREDIAKGNITDSDALRIALDRLLETHVAYCDEKEAKEKAEKGRRRALDAKANLEEQVKALEAEKEILEGKRDGMDLAAAKEAANRWEKLITQGLTNLINLPHEKNLDVRAVVVGRLEGIEAYCREQASNIADEALPEEAKD